MVPADLGVTRKGSGDTLVVFVHGVLARGRGFDRVAACLDSECEMLWYDRRGYGDSAGGEAVGVERHAADLIDIIDGRRAVVVGHSFGGVTAIGAAALSPESVSALVLYETTMAWAPGWNDTVMQGVLASEDPETVGLRMMLGDRYDALTEDERSRRLIEARAFIAEERSARTPTPPFDIARIRAPVVYGSSGLDFTHSVLAELRRKIAHVEAVTLPGAGHHAHRTQPEAFAQMVRRGVLLSRR